MHHILGGVQVVEEQVLLVTETTRLLASTPALARLVRYFVTDC